jgi:hypothetical protein
MFLCSKFALEGTLKTKTYNTVYLEILCTLLCVSSPEHTPPHSIQYFVTK